MRISSPVSFGTAAPVTQAVGDVAAVGVSGAAARSDHRHGMPGFGATASNQAFGDAQTPGVATTFARSDHKHGIPSETAHMFGSSGTFTGDGTGGRVIPHGLGRVPVYVHAKNNTQNVVVIALSSGNCVVLSAGPTITFSGDISYDANNIYVSGSANTSTRAYVWSAI